MPGGFANIAGITARTQKLVYHTCTEPMCAGAGGNASLCYFLKL